jgi:hypothetical protein
MMRRLSRQDGVALPAAMGVMLVISLLVTAFFALSIQTSDNANADRNSKRALAAAEAGLQTAIYRMNSIRPAIDPLTCLTYGLAGVPEEAPGQCPSAVGDLGNGASYEYYVTPELGANAAGCVLLPGRTHDPTDRCVTSIGTVNVGTVNGVSRRVQTRLGRQLFGFSFSQAGLLGEGLVYAWNSVKAWSDVGTNGHVELVNSIEVNSESSLGVAGALRLPPGATTSYTNAVNVAANPDRQTAAPYTLPPENFEAVDGDLAGVPQAGENDNLALIGKTTNTGDLVYDPVTRSLNIETGAFVMPPGTYHFCRVFLDHSVELKRPDAGGPTKIYVDGRDDDRTGSPCTGADDGRFLVNKSVKFNTNTAQGDLTEVYLHGTSRDNLTGTSSDWDRPSWCQVQTGTYLTPDTPDHYAQCRSDFVLESSVEFYGTVYAPNSTIEARNSAKIWGGLAGEAIRLYNSVEFHLTAGARDREQSSQGPALRRAWTECRPERTVANDPESGC